MAATCDAPLTLESLVAYVAGEPADDAFEEHFFGCESCSARLAAVQALRGGIGDLVRRGKVTASVTSDLVDRASAEGVRIRTYRLSPNEAVACTAAPEDDFVLIRLAIPDVSDAVSADLVSDVTNLDDGSMWSRQAEDLIVDRSSNEIVFLFSGDQIRSVPRSRWRMEARVRGGSGERTLGPYTLDHTPWERLSSPS